MAMNVWRCVGTGLLAFLLGPVFGLILGKAGVVYGIAVVGLCLAGRMGFRADRPRQSAAAGMLTMVGPALAAGLPARWIAEALFYNRHITAWEQVQVSTGAFVLFMAIGALAGLLGHAIRPLGRMRVHHQPGGGR